MRRSVLRRRTRLGHAARRLHLEPLEDRRLLSLSDFSILGPSGEIGDDTPEITWEASSGAYAYDVVVDDDPGLGSPLVEAEGVSGTSYTLADPLEPGTYYIGVTARENLPPVVDVGPDTDINEGSFFLRFGSFTDDDATLQATNNGLEFTVVAPGPGEFDITGPIGVVDIETPTVTWEASEGATSYDLVISDSVDLSTVVFEYFDLTTTSQVLDPLANGTYYVGVTAEDAGGLTTDATNNGHSFVVGVSYPAPFMITGPVSPVTATETPTVTWEASANSTGYDLIISTDIEGLVPVQTYDNLTTTAQLLDPLANGTYYVNVTAFDNFGHETPATNNGYAFEVLVQPPGPFLITGPTAPVNAQTATISWQASERAVEYDLIVSTAMDCSVVTQSFVGLTELSQETDTLANGTYYACVTARDIDGRTTTASNNGYAFEIAYVPPKTHTIFVTSMNSRIDQTEQYPPLSPDFGGLSAADYVCTELAFYAGLLTTWDFYTPVYTAILSTPTVNARDRFVIEGDIKNTAGEVVANSSMGLWSGNLVNGVKYNEYGQLVPDGSAYVWTGTAADGTYNSASCGSWNQNKLTATATDRPTATDSGWISGELLACNQSARIYCISPPLNASDASSTGPGAPSDSLLTEEMIEAVLQQAIAYWAGQGIDTSSLPSDIGVAIANLGGTELGLRTEGIDGFSLDRDAAAWGWYSSPHPDPLPEGEGDWIDLLSATVHEVGHLLGLEHNDQGTYDVMATPLDPGSRPASLDAWTQAGPGAWTARVDYGDGGGWEPLTLNPDGTFGLAHQYGDNGTYTVTVEITDEHGAVGTDTLELTVNNVAPGTQILTYDKYLDEGGTFTGSGIFADPGDDTWTVTVDYGDGSPVETLIYGDDNRYELSHTYDQQGEYTVVVTVTDDDGGEGQTGRVISVYNVTPEITSTQVVPDTINEGQSVTVSGTFTDPGVEDSHVATVDWGDGTSSPATIDSGTFSATHTYDDDPAGTPDVYEITVQIRDTDTVTPTGFVEWNGHAYGLNDRAVCWQGVEADAHALSGDLVQIDLAEEQAFLVANLLADQPLWTGLHDYDDEGNFHWIGQEPLTYTNWAPGEPAAGEDFSYVLIDPDGTWRAVGVWGDGGHYGIVEIGVWDIATANVTVNNVVPTVDAGTDVSIFEGETLQRSGSFSDPGADQWTATVDYGAGEEALPLTNKTFALEQTYTVPGTYTVTVRVNDGDDGTGTGTFTVTVQELGTISGMVWEDFNNDADVNFGEKAIGGVAVTLTGANDLDPIVPVTNYTDEQGFYMFVDLRPGEYTITETQPTGYEDGQESLGTVDGAPSGVVADDAFSGVVLVAGSEAVHYNFGERPLADGPVTSGQAATIGFWHNKHGQILISSVNDNDQEGDKEYKLGNWLAATLPNMYGDLAGQTNDEVADFYSDLFLRKKKEATRLGLTGPTKMDAQVMAVALATYMTNDTLAGTIATDYGFLVTEHGLGIAEVNVGEAGAAFEAENYSQMTVLDLLFATNKWSSDGVLYDVTGDGDTEDSDDDFDETLWRILANNIYSAINEQGSR